MKFLKKYLRDRQFFILLILILFSIFIITFSLYNLQKEIILYPAVLALVFCIIFFIFDFRSAYKKNDYLNKIKNHLFDLAENLPQSNTLDDENYQEIIRLLDEEKRHRDTEMNIRYQDMIEYYTIWAHQIKTPIASVRLTLQNEDSKLSKSLEEDIFRIEQYVEMVMTFLRLDYNSTDYVIAQYDLDKIVRASVKKFAGQFINRGISLDYNLFETTVLTDEKWLSFVIEQILSNAIKYTPKGKITIYLDDDKTLCIKDTGIGIASEDLPRIFDKGYTGYNGRLNKKASGIGLYLCKRICDNLNHTISADSELDKGTEIRINLSSENLEIE